MRCIGVEEYGLGVMGIYAVHGSCEGSATLQWHLGTPPGGGGSSQWLGLGSGWQLKGHWLGGEHRGCCNCRWSDYRWKTLYWLPQKCLDMVWLPMKSTRFWWTEKSLEMVGLPVNNTWMCSPLKQLKMSPQTRASVARLACNNATILLMWKSASKHIMWAW